MKNLLTIILLTTFASAFGQTKGDSSTYWVNTKFVACLDSGKSVCECQQQNDLLLIFRDGENKLRIDPAVFFSWEPVEIPVKCDSAGRCVLNNYEGYSMDTTTVLQFSGNQLTLTNLKQHITFAKTTFQPIEKWRDSDMWRQVGRMSCKPLLKYAVKSCSGTNLLLPLDELSNAIDSGYITISCSDDYHYNQMYNHKTKTSYFLVYDTDTVTAYKHPERGRGEKIDVSLLKECQVFYKPKN